MGVCFSGAGVGSGICVVGRGFGGGVDSCMDGLFCRMQVSCSFQSLNCAILSKMKAADAGATSTKICQIPFAVHNLVEELETKNFVCIFSKL